MIFLIGMPGTGKSYWGRRLSAHYKLPFVDMDDYIMQAGQKTIAELFDIYGEHQFRITENKVLRKVIDNNTANTIVACGGGTPCFMNNMLLMQQAGAVVYLRAGIPLLLSHLQDEIAKRPLLERQKDMETYLQQLLNTRRSIYEQANYILDTENISLTNFDQIITVCTNRH